MKKIIIVFALLFPSIASATTSVPWLATSTPSSFISPSVVNGINQAIKINGDATSTINKLDVGILNVPIITSSPTGRVNISGTGNCLTVDSPSLVVDCTNHRVGINTSSPAYNLSVAPSSGAATVGIFAADNAAKLRLGRTGSAVHQYSLFAGNSDQSFQIIDETSASTRLAISSTGNVGIGTTSPATLLDIAGTSGTTFRVSRSDSSQYTYLTNPSNNVANLGVITGGASYPITFGYVGGSSGLGIGSSTPYATLSVQGRGTGTGVTFQTTNSSQTPLITALDNGNLGIGTTTPPNKLTVQETGSLSAAKFVSNTNTSVDTIQLQSLASNAYASLAFLNTSGTAMGGFGYANTGVASTLSDNVYFYSVSRDMAFSTNGGSAELLTLKAANGGVGIGTTTPAQALSVQGNELVSGNISAANITATGTIQGSFKSSDGTSGFTGSGTSCTITAIKNGIVTAASCI